MSSCHSDSWWRIYTVKIFVSICFRGKLCGNSVAGLSRIICVYFINPYWFYFYWARYNFFFQNKTLYSYPDKLTKQRNMSKLIHRFSLNIVMAHESHLLLTGCFPVMKSHYYLLCTSTKVSHYVPVMYAVTSHSGNTSLP